MKSMFAIAVLLASTVVHSQEYDRPVGATGPAVQYTERVTGTIIAVGSPIYQNIPILVNCPNAQTQQPEEHNVVNGGSILGAIVGGVAGSQVGGGRGKTAATIAGTALGAYVGDQANRKIHARPAETQATACMTTFEQRIIGWTFTALYEGIQVQGVMRSQPQVGHSVPVIVTSKFYAGE